MTQPTRPTFCEEFYSAYDTETSFEFDEPLKAAMWAAKWAMERCALKLETMKAFNLNGAPTIKNKNFVLEQGVKEIRQLAKEIDQ